MIVDLHSDFPSDVLYRRRHGEHDSIQTVWLPRWKAAGVKVVVGAVFVENLFVSNAREYALEMIECVAKECASSAQVRLVRTYREIEAALSDDCVSILLSLEGAEPLSAGLQDLQRFYDLGVRFLGLCWSRPGPAGYGHTFDPNEPQSREGLTSLGRKLLRQCEELGVILDVSHLNDPGFADVERNTRKPFIASHSNSRAVWNSPRNLTDRQAAVIAERGGLLGLNAVDIIAGAGIPSQNPLTRHAEHWRTLWGTSAIACGFDFGQDIHYFEEPVPGQAPSYDVIPGYPGVTEWVQELTSYGWRPGEISGALSDNVLRFWKRWL